MRQIHAQTLLTGNICTALEPVSLAQTISNWTNQSLEKTVKDLSKRVEKYMSNSVLYEFAGFRMDTEQGCLMRGDEVVPLTPKAFDTLLVLVKSPGKVVSKDALLDEVWKDTFVEESTLAQNISTLRKALSKYQEGTDFIVTIPRRGYRFVADVSEIGSEEEILVVEKRSVTHIVTEQQTVEDQKTKTGSGSLKWIIGVPAAVAAIFAAFFAYSFYAAPDGQYETKFREFQMAPLFSGENILQSTVSPDGKYIAVVESKTDGEVILLRQISDGNAVSLTQEKDLNISGIVFSPNSDSVYYSAYKKSEPFPKYGNLYNVPLLGGASRLINKDVDGPISFSSDKKRFAFVRGVLETSESVLMTAKLDGTDEKKISSRSLMDGFSTNGVSWSPDGKTIAVTAYDRKDQKRPMKLLAVDANSGESKVLSDHNWLWIGRAAWLRDGSGIAVIAYADETPNLTDEVWFVSYPEGKARSVTRGLTGITGVGITDDGNTMIAGKNNRLTTRSFIELEDPAQTKVIAKTVSEDNMTSLGARWIENSQLAYARVQNGSADIWTMNLDGSLNRQLTSEVGADFDPYVSPDRKHIYFRSNRTGRMTVWRMKVDGSNQEEIIDSLHASKPSMPADGSRMYYSSQPEDKDHAVLWRSDPKGGERKKLSDLKAFFPSVSPDGKYLLCFAADQTRVQDDPAAPIRLTLFSTADNKIIRQFEPAERGKLPLYEWKRDSSGFYQIVSKEQSSELLSRNLEGEVEKSIRNWNEGKVFQIALSDDGKRLFIEKGEDVVSVLKFTNSGGV